MTIPQNSNIGFLGLVENAEKENIERKNRKTSKMNLSVLLIVTIKNTLSNQ
jgi:hypothetical protein